MSKAPYRKFGILMVLLLSMFVLAVGLVQGAGLKSGVNAQPDEVPLNTEIEVRRSLGFRSDRGYVEAVRASNNAVVEERFGNMALTPAEARELGNRIDLEKDGDVLQEFFENSDVRGAFAGIYVEHAAGSEDHAVGGQLVLQLVQDHARANEIPAMLPSLEQQERLQIEFVEFSDEHLKQQFRTISEAASQHSEMRGVFITRKNNRVNVAIVPSNAWTGSNGVVDKSSLPDDLAILVADPSVVVQEAEVEEELTIVRGGEPWDTSNRGNGICTLGFKVKYNNINSMLTAGHCVKNLSYGQYVYQGLTRIGTFSGAWTEGASSSSGNGVDAGVLYINQQVSAYDDVTHYSSSRDIRGSTSNYNEGNWRCWTGKTSGTKCGVIECESLTYSTTGGKWFTDMFSVDPSSTGGDSGSPAYRPETSYKASVTGIMRSNLSGFACMNGYDAVFSKWHHIRDYFGLTLVTDN